MIQKFSEFLNEGKKLTENDKLIDNFNNMLEEIENEFLKDPLKVTKAFGKSAKDLFSGNFICETELDLADQNKIKLVYKKIKK